MASTLSDASDPWYNIPEIVAGDLRDLKATARLLQGRVAALEQREASLRSENALLREQLTGVAQILTTYPTARQFAALRSELAAVRSEIWRPTTEFVATISERVLEALAAEEEAAGEGAAEGAAAGPEGAPGPTPRGALTPRQRAAGAARGALAGPRFNPAQLQTLVQEQVALEVSRVSSRIAELQGQLGDKADKAGVAAAVSQRLDEVYAFVERLRDGVREVLAQKTDVAEVNRVLERKADARLVSEALERYALAASVEAQLGALEARVSELAEQEAFGRLAQRPAGPAERRGRGPAEGPEPASFSAAEARNLQQAVSSLADETRARFSKLELSLVAASQSAEERARQATETCLSRFREALATLDVNVRANSALIAKAQASAEQARSDAALARQERARAGGDRALGAAIAPLTRDVADLSGRLLAAEAALRRKIDRSELQTVKRQLEAAPAMRTVSEALTARPTLDQVRSIIRDLVQGAGAPAEGEGAAEEPREWHEWRDGPYGGPYGEPYGEPCGEPRGEPCAERGPERGGV